MRGAYLRISTPILSSYSHYIMFTLTESQFSAVVSAQPNGWRVELRTSPDRDLFGRISKHELDLLRLQPGCWVKGQANKKGFCYGLLTVDARRASRLLLRLVMRPNIPMAEDSRTCQTTITPCGGIVYSHAHNYAYSPEARRSNT